MFLLQEWCFPVHRHRRSWSLIPVGFTTFVDTCLAYGQAPGCGWGYYESDNQIDGLPVATQFDELVNYSAHILDAWQDYYPLILPVETYGVYDFATGTGGLDVILYTGAGTKDRNQGVGPDLGIGKKKVTSISKILWLPRLEAKPFSMAGGERIFN